MSSTRMHVIVEDGFEPLRFLERACNHRGFRSRWVRQVMRARHEGVQRAYACLRETMDVQSIAGAMTMDAGSSAIQFLIEDAHDMGATFRDYCLAMEEGYK